MPQARIRLTGARFPLRWCGEPRIDFLAALAYAPAVTEVMVLRQAVTEFHADGVSAEIRRVWRRIVELGNQKAKAV